ncbi:MAG: enamine deaminase RidA (YjgF/YER057c/UK114 family) [Kiritimatiellia bacterium]|jgi:enamine deaminase RidA (YjgF/YER057c/UK114 family)
MSVEDRLLDLGIDVPTAPKPAGNYIPWVRTGNLVYIAGQVPMKDGEFHWVGKVGRDFSIEQGKQAARMVGFNVLSQLKAALDGDLNRVVRTVKLNGFVNCTPDFIQQPAVINGASELIIEVFGDVGRHARSAVGAASLPFGVAVEVDGVFEVRDG